MSTQFSCCTDRIDGAHVLSGEADLSASHTVRTRLGQILATMNLLFELCEVNASRLMSKVSRPIVCFKEL